MLLGKIAGMYIGLYGEFAPRRSFLNILSELAFPARTGIGPEDFLALKIDENISKLTAKFTRTIT